MPRPTSPMAPSRRYQATRVGDKPVRSSSWWTSIVTPLYDRYRPAAITITPTRPIATRPTLWRMIEAEDVESAITVDERDGAARGSTGILVGARACGGSKGSDEQHGWVVTPERRRQPCGRHNPRSARATSEHTCGCGPSVDGLVTFDVGTATAVDSSNVSGADLADHVSGVDLADLADNQGSCPVSDRRTDGADSPGDALTFAHLSGNARLRGPIGLRRAGRRRPRAQSPRGWRASDWAACTARRRSCTSLSRPAPSSPSVTARSSSADDARVGRCTSPDLGQHRSLRSARSLLTSA